MQLALGSAAVSSGYSLCVVDAIGSTNTELLRIGREQRLDKLWFFAHKQTDGRGRRGRTWDNYNGSLACSLLLTMFDDLRRISSLGFVAGLAIIDAALSVAGFGHAAAKARTDCFEDINRQSTRLALKWPNDVLLDGKKIAGILVETERLSSNCRIVVIGIGVNVVAPRFEIHNQPRGILVDLCSDVTLDGFFARLTDAWARLFDCWEENGLSNLVPLWLDYSVGRGGLVKVVLETGSISGVFETIDHRGFMLVRGNDGKRYPISPEEVCSCSVSHCLRDN